MTALDRALELLRQAIEWNEELERDVPDADKVVPEWRREASEWLRERDETLNEQAKESRHG